MCVHQSAYALKCIPILTGGFGAQGSSTSPAARAPRSAKPLRAPPPGASKALEAPARSIRIALLRAALSVPLFCARSRSGALRLSTRSPGRPRGPAAHVRILAALALLRSLGGWLRLSLLIPEGKRIVPASWKVEFFHVKSLCSAWRVGNTPQTLAAAI